MCGQTREIDESGVTRQSWKIHKIKFWPHAWRVWKVFKTPGTNETSTKCFVQWQIYLESKKKWVNILKSLCRKFSENVNIYYNIILLSDWGWLQPQWPKLQHDAVLK